MTVFGTLQPNPRNKKVCNNKVAVHLFTILKEFEKMWLDVD